MQTTVKLVLPCEITKNPLVITNACKISHRLEACIILVWCTNYARPEAQWTYRNLTFMPWIELLRHIALDLLIWACRFSVPITPNGLQNYFTDWNCLKSLSMAFKKFCISFTSFSDLYLFYLSHHYSAIMKYDNFTR